MKNIIFTICFLASVCMCVLSANAQTATQGWAQRYEGNFIFAEGRSIALDATGNIYVSGRGYDSLAEFNYVTVKYNSSGALLWAKTYNGPGNDDDFAYYLALDPSGNVYVSGYSKGDGTGWDYCTIKYNSDGVQQWLQRYNGTGNGEDHVSAMEVDNSGNVYLTGWSYGPIAGSTASGMSFTTIKYNTAGAQQWVKKYNAPPNTLNPGNDYAYALKTDNSGNIYVAGKSMGMGGHPMSFLQYSVVIKYNSFGDSVWVARYCDPDSLSLSQIAPSKLAVSSSGNVFVTGACAFVNFNNTRGVDCYTVKYNSTGVFQWIQKYNGPGPVGSNNDQPTAIGVDVNNVYITSASPGNTSGYDYATIKYDFSGVQQWAQRYNGPGNAEDIPSSIKVDDLGNSYVTGISVRNPQGISDIATIKYDYFGNQRWLMRYTGNADEACGGNGIAISSYGFDFITDVVYVTGVANNSLAIVKYFEQVGIHNISGEIPEAYSLKQNYPNPFNPGTVIRYQLPAAGYTLLKVFDLTGKEIETLVNENQKAGTYEADFNGGLLPSGVYFYKIRSGSFIATKRMLLVK